MSRKKFALAPHAYFDSKRYVASDDRTRGSRPHLPVVRAAPEGHLYSWPWGRLVGVGNVLPRPSPQTLRPRGIVPRLERAIGRRFVLYRSIRSTTALRLKYPKRRQQFASECKECSRGTP